MAMSASVTDMGVMVAALMAQIGQTTLTTINIAAQVAIAYKKYQLAQKYLDIAEEARQHYEGTFAPCEDTEREEACGSYGVPPIPEVANMHRIRFSILRQFKGQIRDSIRRLPSWATGAATERILLIEQKKARMASYAEAFGEKVLMAKFEAERDRSFSKLLTALNRGRDLPAQSIMFGGQAAGILETFKFNWDWQSYKPKAAYE
jgi:hypothetical protein